MIPTSTHIIFTLFDISLLVVVPLSLELYLLSGCSIILSMYTNLNNKRNNDSPPRTIIFFQLPIITNLCDCLRCPSFH